MFLYIETVPFQDYPRLQPTDTFINIGGIQIPKNNEVENSKALKGMSEVGLFPLAPSRQHQFLFCN